ncbi:MAG: hypothetical protein CVU05_09345 [Bacteroidetes bacterium HGW-Bacteroidetes-21]|jgi:hypothetical protein|nr:MAG: hypothetical protein CVU05_09345 [Bacteroidetes bacterium HGW-Bacteroidetes-21]
MRNRTEILKNLVLLQDNIENLKIELSKFVWDSELPLYSISIEDFTSVLKRCINNEIDFKILTSWANAIECRDDIEFKNEVLQEIVFEIANPEINGNITKERLQEIVNKLLLKSSI